MLMMKNIQNSFLYYELAGAPANQQQQQIQAGWHFKNNERDSGSDSKHHFVATAAVLTAASKTAKTENEAVSFAPSFFFSLPQNYS